MYREETYKGDELPSKHLCLTYDDGPGKNTLEIAAFLHSHNIHATFFVVGKYAIEYDDILQKVAELGHLIGNHTFEHPDMPYYLSRNGDVQNQILRTDAIIKKYNPNNTMYFRTPYGKWSKEVSDELNANVLTAINHVGPIDWDIAGIDCYYWRKGISIEKTVQKYLADIREKDHGIVVMHDEIADMEFLQPENKTLELTKRLIPILKSEGYEFVRLDEIPSIKKDSDKQLSIIIKTSTGNYVSLNQYNAITIASSTTKISDTEFLIKDVGLGKFAIIASNKLFWSYDEKNGNIIQASKKQAADNEQFALIPLHNNKVILRAFNGNYLRFQDKQGRILSASAEYMRGAEIFTILPKGIKSKTNVSLITRLKNLQRQFLYVKSKIQERI
jgi:peptidoglycan/xylan/chitin deacetylase (PgdA/CDA1 family)